ncbi:MAG: type II toxin-antitoxin system mRNA interferase toxin, RelE/StbE family [Candidatus Spechtbacteria bacterium]|nr:type II toxin-antitoxin system mRNA interferase toxin, RelE/StbE family [Candidatus Spechtbacteria bacterium]
MRNSILSYDSHCLRKSFSCFGEKIAQASTEKLAQLLEIFVENPFHTKLHSKHLTGKLSGLYSFRITRDWRVIFQFISTKEIQLIEVAHRREIYR